MNRIVTLVGCCDLALGLLLMLQPSARLSSPSLAAARSVPGGLTAVGVVILAVGVAVLLLAAVPQGIACSAGAAWYGFFAATLAYSATQHATAGVTALPLYVTVLVLHLLVAAGRLR